jgi:hypothetical protein
MLKKTVIKDWMLYCTVLVSYFPSLFHGNKTKLDLFLLVEHSRRIDFYLMYLGHSINYLILLFLLLFPKDISVRAKQFVFLVCILDFLHYVLLSKLYFGFVKIFVAIFIYVVLRQIKKWMVLK